MTEASKALTILHTSDWHLGRSLYGRKRYQEHAAFLEWLVSVVEREQVDVLLIAGDVFDSATPSNRAQELYFNFLRQIALSSCRHVVVIAGNHDSPSFLNASRELLSVLNVHVTGSAPENAEEEVIVLRADSGDPELIVCAVPYLREKDLRVFEAGESLEDKDRKSVEGIAGHYAEVFALAEARREALGGGILLVGMGHLFAAGGKTVEGDGVRDLYVGSLAHVSAAVFPKSLDYVALGHLHVPQTVNSSETIRYSGSPLPMGFGEAEQEKSVCLVRFSRGKSLVELVPVPVFQPLKRLRGSLPALLQGIRELAASDSTAWLELVYEGEELVSDLREQLEEAVEGSGLALLRIHNSRLAELTLSREHAEEDLAELDADEVFERCLAAHDIPQEQRQELLRAYREILYSLAEAEPQG